MQNPPRSLQFHEQRPSIRVRDVAKGGAIFLVLSAEAVVSWRCDNGWVTVVKQGLSGGKSGNKGAMYSASSEEAALFRSLRV